MYGNKQLQFSVHIFPPFLSDLYVFIIIITLLLNRSLVKLLNPTFLLFYSWYAREKRGREVPGPSKKVPGLLDLFSPGTTGPRDLQGL